MISHKNMILLLALVAIFGAVAVSVFSMRQAAYKKSLDAQTETLKTVSANDDLNSIEKDLNSTNLDSLDKESSEIQTLLN